MIIVTGGAGFIGSCIVARLNQRGRKDIVIVDHVEKNHPKEENLQNLQYEQYFDKTDFLRLIQDGGIRKKLPTPPSAIIHMGACSSTTLTDAVYYQQNNFEYSCHVADYALREGARFVYASSAATYGDGSLGYKDDESLITQLKPLNLYGESKQRFDLWVLDRGYNKKFVGLKFFNVFGPNEYHKGDMRSVVSKAYQRVADEGRMALFKSYRPDYKDGEQKRDFIYVQDAVDVVEYFLQHPDVNGIYNVGTGQARSWNDLARALFAAVGKPVRIDYVEMPEKLKAQYQYFTQADMSKLRAAGYTRPFATLEAAVRDYVQYLKAHRYIGCAA